MAQVGFTPIQLYYSNTSGNSPAALANGEIALNQADGKLYYKTSTGVIRVLAASEVEVQVYNNTGSTIPQGSAVYLSGGATGQTPHISLAIATSAAAANVLGLTTAAIATGTAGYVTTIGLSATFNTSSFTNGDALYLSSSVAGALTATAPTSPNYAVRVGFVSYANATGRVFITMTNQYVQVSSIIGTVSPTQGGTGLTTYATGDILYASSSNVLSKLPAGSNTQILTLVSGVPAWAAPAVSGVTSFQTSLSGLTPSTSTTGSVTLAGTLGAGSGGTGLTSYATGDIIYASGTTTLANLAAGTSSYVLTSNGAGTAPSWQAAPSASGVTSISFGSTGLTPATGTTGAVTVAGILVPVNGGTGVGSYAQGEMLYANTTTTLDKVTANTTTNKRFLSQTGNGTAGLAPTWDQPSATDLTGTLPVANGGTGQTTYIDGELLIGNSTGNTLAKATLTAGSGISITNGSGAITIAATGGGVTSPVNGGTGVANNAASTITISGSFASTFTLSGITSVTFPTTGTLATLAGSEAFTNKTLTNPTVTNYVESVVAIGNSGTSQTLALTNGTVQTVTMTGSCTFTMPALVAGKSFILIIATGAGSFTGTFTGVKWPGGTAPTLTVTASKNDILTFVCDGSFWYGNSAQAY
jgi:hypothetical protein